MRISVDTFLKMHRFLGRFLPAKIRDEIMIFAYRTARYVEHRASLPGKIKVMKSDGTIEIIKVPRPAW